MEWRQGTLGEIILFKNGKKRPQGSGVIPVYGGNGILDYTNENNYANCIIIGRVGAYCGSVYYEPDACWVSDNAIAALPKGKTDTRFAYYLLNSLHLNRHHIGTSQPLLTQEILNGLSCTVPNYDAQKKIAKVLQTIDEKINANTAINDNLAA